MQGFQPQVLQIDSQSYAGTAVQFITKLDKLTDEFNRQHLHVVKFVFELDVLTHTTSSGSTTPTQFNSLFDRIEFNDGRQPRFVGTGRDLWAFERLESGGRRVPDPLTCATTVLTEVRRTLHVGPPKMDGSPTDFAIPAAMLTKGFLSVRLQAATGANANITALTANYKVFAVVVGKTELRIPPFIERKVVGVSADDTIPGRALVPFLGLGNSSSWDAITAADFGSITVRTGKGEVVSAVDAAGLTAAYNDDFALGESGGMIGDPRGTGDVTVRELNPGTPTALQSATAAIQPVLWMQPDARMSKVMADVENTLGVKYSGAGTTTVAAITRVLPQNRENVDDFARMLKAKVGGNYKLVPKPLNKGGHFGPDMAPFAPWELKPIRG